MEINRFEMKSIANLASQAGRTGLKKLSSSERKTLAAMMEALEKGASHVTVDKGTFVHLQNRLVQHTYAPAEAPKRSSLTERIFGRGVRSKRLEEKVEKAQKATSHSPSQKYRENRDRIETAETESEELQMRMQPDERAYMRDFWVRVRAKPDRGDLQSEKKQLIRKMSHLLPKGSPLRKEIRKNILSPSVKEGLIRLGPTLPVADQAKLLIWLRFLEDLNAAQKLDSSQIQTFVDSAISRQKEALEKYSQAIKPLQETLTQSRKAAESYLHSPASAQKPAGWRRQGLEEIQQTIKNSIRLIALLKEIKQDWILIAHQPGDTRAVKAKIAELGRRINRLDKDSTLVSKLKEHRENLRTFLEQTASEQKAFATRQATTDTQRSIDLLERQIKLLIQDADYWQKQERS